jgi:hypothetical protein
LQKVDGQYVFVDNPRPVVITHSMHGVELNSEESNFHMVEFCWQDNWIILDVFHAMTDGTGAYEVVRTLLYYYCSERYQAELSAEGIRLVGDVIDDEEWADPVVGRRDLPVPQRTEMPPALDILKEAGLEGDDQPTVYSIAVQESEFMGFNLDNDGSPATMVALLLSRSLAKLYPDAAGVIRIIVCVNQRKALHAPLAHQSLVGAAYLEYKDKMRDWDLERQGTVYRGMVFAQAQEENVLAGVASTSGMARMILAQESDRERLGMVSNINKLVPNFKFGKLGFGAPVKCMCCNVEPVAECYDTDMELVYEKFGNLV